MGDNQVSKICQDRSIEMSEATVSCAARRIRHRRRKEQAGPGYDSDNDADVTGLKADGNEYLSYLGYKVRVYYDSDKNIYGLFLRGQQRRDRNRCVYRRGRRG
jgi:hypothetical protein